MLDIQHPDNPLVEFPIERAKYYNAICDDIDKHQSDIALMSEWGQDAAEQMKITIDSEGLGSVYADADSDNTGITAGKDSGIYDMGVAGNPVSITKENVIDILMDMTACLDEQNVPESNRWYALASWVCNLIKKSEIKDVSMTGDSRSVSRHGRIGSIDNNPILKSNQIHRVVDGITGNNAYYNMAGHKDAITFASQITKTETLQSERTFGRLIRGLNVHDYKVIKGQGLVTAYSDKA